ncbi:hypothetical protein B0H11DRAFT_227019 [Mycena galericulata]|nr:hypothetical protein B0H11DRAFT_227019 [Mycena galericulata]
MSFRSSCLSTPEATRRAARSKKCTLTCWRWNSACGTASGSTHCSRRQQRSERAATDEKKEYRHAFLIVEAKRGPGRNHPRHVLCADSDADRDSWVEMFVRYFSDSYSEEFVSYGQLAFSNSGNNG